MKNGVVYNNGKGSIAAMEVLLNDVQMIIEFVLEHLVFLNLVLGIIIVFFQRKDPKSVWAWLLILYFIPILGFVFYLLIGTDMHKKKMFRTKEIEDKLSDAIRRQESIIRNSELVSSYPEMGDYGDMVLYHLRVSESILTDDNRVDFFVDGREKFAAMAEDIRKAKKSIHIQYYIIGDDELFAELKEILKQKISEGVEVRILFDAMGCREVKRRFWKELEREGFQIGEFFPAIFGRLQLRINYRNHRKIVVIDGKIGYTGGFNLAREYVSLDPKFGYWRDTHMRITGSAVGSLQTRFILDWNFAVRDKTLVFERYMAEPEPDGRSGSPVQIVTSGPDSGIKAIRDTYLRMIHKAKKSIYIQTPYFIPDEAIMSALVIAVRSGIEVCVMIPCRPDHPFVYWATYSYVGELVMQGAKCYTYENGFIHAKGIIVDEMVLCYGTANMDIRSFALNFEVNAIIYDKKKAEEMVGYFKEDLKNSKLITKNSYAIRSLWIRFKEQVSRLLSPLL